MRLQPSRLRLAAEPRASEPVTIEGKSMRSILAERAKQAPQP
jgi:hypothetical protein